MGVVTLTEEPEGKGAPRSGMINMFFRLFDPLEKHLWNNAGPVACQSAVDSARRFDLLLERAHQSSSCSWTEMTRELISRRHRGHLLKGNEQLRERG